MILPGRSAVLGGMTGSSLTSVNCSLHNETTSEGIGCSGLRDALRKAQDESAAIGHFNIADLVLLKAVFAAARELNVPVL